MFFTKSGKKFQYATFWLYLGGVLFESGLKSVLSEHQAVEVANRFVCMY
jgi:hypothetical protein